MVLLGRPLSPIPSCLSWTSSVLFAIFFVASIAEEAGWTGYATDPLRERTDALRAALVIGAVWGALHVVPDLQGGHDLGWIAWHHVVGAIALRILFVWVYSNTGVVLAAVLMHAMENLSWQLSSASAPYDPSITGPIFAAAAAVVVLLWGPATLARRRHARRAGSSPAASPTTS